MPRKYPFYPSWNGRKASPVVEWFLWACERRWGFHSLGVYQNRTMRGSENLSVHATGWAVDLGYPNTKDGRKAAVEAWDWLIANTKALRIAEIHDYSFRNPEQSRKDKTAWGRGYRCSRGEGERGIKLFNSQDNAGTPNGKWLHVEIENTWKNADEFEAAWRAIPKPGQQ